MKYIKLLLLLVLPVFCFSQCDKGLRNQAEATTTTPLDNPNEVFTNILVGQSNAQGVNGTTGWPSEYLVTQEDSYAHQCVGTILPLTPGAMCEAGVFGVGIETALNPILRDRCEKPVTVLKNGYGGASLGDSQGNTWRVDATIGSRLDDWKTTWDDYKSQMDAQCKVIKIGAIIWVQGEADAANQALADNYQVNEANLVEAMRDYMGHGEVLFISTLLSSSANMAFRVDVNNAKLANEAALNNYLTINTDAIPLNLDNVHFTNVGLLQLSNIIDGLIECN